MKKLTYYLMKYYKIQKEIMLVYRPTLKSNWAYRCLFLDKDYESHIPYNHRSILRNEIILEWDDDNEVLNKRYAYKIGQKLKKDGIKICKWSSGNKSVHVHCLVDLKSAKNIPLLKKVFIRHYCEGLPLPDLRLCVSNHLIRAEYGVHEKTGNKKLLISKDKDYPMISSIPKIVWEKYVKAATTNMKRKVTRNLADVRELKGFKYVLTSHQFREAEDGRERALFMLIHVMKEQYAGRKEEFLKFLQEWYRYSGGYKLLDAQIKRKLDYHWKKDYNVGEKYLNELLESIGMEHLIKTHQKVYKGLK